MEKISKQKFKGVVKKLGDVMNDISETSALDGLTILA